MCVCVCVCVYVCGCIHAIMSVMLLFWQSSLLKIATRWE